LILEALLRRTCHVPHGRGLDSSKPKSGQPSKYGGIAGKGQQNYHSGWEFVTIFFGSQPVLNPYSALPGIASNRSVLDDR
jgi:hypothetical protein